MNWINVNDQLPPNDTECIVWVKTEKNEGFREVIFNSNYFEVTDNRFVHYENGGEYEQDYTNEVTHWMIPTKPNQ